MKSYIVYEYLFTFFHLFIFMIIHHLQVHLNSTSSYDFWAYKY
jgi:hypothetical protein